MITREEHGVLVAKAERLQDEFRRDIELMMQKARKETEKLIEYLTEDLLALHPDVDVMPITWSTNEVGLPRIHLTISYPMIGSSDTEERT